MDYQNKTILAPMVRIGTLPIRLLSLRYGADIVYTEELIDFKLLQCKRRENPVLQTVDYVWTDGATIFRTCAEEKGRVILQMGTSDAKRAEKVAKWVEKDVSGIDVNMGCPKEFSVKGGMGAALLKQPEKAREILTTLVQAVSVPVTCKIRILDTLEDTLQFVKMVESTGVVAIAVHGRTKNERPRHENHNDIIRKIAETVKIPVIANGGSNDIRQFEDIHKFQEATGSAAVMVARQAQWNPSVFRKEGPLPINEVIREYLKCAVDFDSHEMNVKYCMQQLYHDDLDTPRGRALLCAVNTREICALWEMDGYFDEVAEQRRKRESELSALAGQTSGLKKRKLEDGSEIVEMCFKYNRKEYPNSTGPKMILYTWTRKNDLPKPQYITSQNKVDRTFSTVVHVDGKKYSSTWWEKSKKNSEQATAAVCLLSMGMADGRRDTGTCSQGNDRHKLSQGAQQQEVPDQSFCSAKDDRGMHDPTTKGNVKELASNGQSESVNTREEFVEGQSLAECNSSTRTGADVHSYQKVTVETADGDGGSAVPELANSSKR